ncbi:MAG TPA: YCF48-related protein [Blastocatellia bacterium]|jgi:photosystem II stability/assembly factor-like uncharacterized protein
MLGRFFLLILVTAALLAAACSKSSAPSGEWAFVETGTSDSFFTINFVNESIGWINGYNSGTNVFANNNTNSNTSKPLKPGEKPPDPLKQNQGFQVLHTTDGGQTWGQMPDLFKHKIREVWFVDQQQGWALTIDRNILRTSDGGATWSEQRKAGTVQIKVPSNRAQPVMTQPEQIERIYFINATHGWAWGGGQKDERAEQPGILLATVNGGQSWTSIPYPFDGIVIDIFFLDPQRAWASSKSGGFYKTSDGGLTWERSEVIVYGDRVFESIFFADANTGWVASRSGRMARTTDGGRTWEKLFKVKEEFHVREIFFTDKERGWAVGDQGVILYTTDGGDQWVSVDSPMRENLTELILINDRLGWAAGQGGTLIKYSGQ